MNPTPGRTPPPAALVLFGFFAFALLGPRKASAQLHWDVGISAGVADRFTTGGAAHTPRPEPGPVGELRAHLAMVPMLRAGPYLVHDISPVSGIPARQLTEAGLELRLTPPIVHAPFRTWVFAGVGYARAYAPSYVTTSPTGGQERAAGAGGGFLGVPFGIGVGVKVRAPWVFFAELGGRAGLLFTGSLYEPASCLCGNRDVGKDSFAAALSVGVSFEP